MGRSVGINTEVVLMWVDTSNTDDPEKTKLYHVSENRVLTNFWQQKRVHSRLLFLLYGATLHADG